MPLSSIVTAISSKSTNGSRSAAVKVSGSCCIVCG